MKCPYGAMEDVLVKVKKFTFLVNFVILDMEKDMEVPLILEIPFLKIAKVIIDVNDNKLKIRDQDKDVNFDAFKAIHNHKSNQRILVL